MNRYRYPKLLLVLLVLFTASSCEDWLDVTSNSEIRAEDQFSSEGGFKDALTGVYVNMNSEEIYGKNLSWYMVDLMSQLYLDIARSSPYYPMTEYEYESTYGSQKVDEVWSKAYNIIANINNELEYIDKKREVLGAYDYDIIKGELLGLRAFIHFDLMRLYGYGNLEDRSGVMGEPAIPYVTDYTKYISTQKSYSETFELIYGDIEEGLELLKSDPVYTFEERGSEYESEIALNEFYSDRHYRMNYYALKALQARILLWQGGTNNLAAARDAAEEVIENAPVNLIDSQTYPVASDPVLHPEILFSLQYEGFDDEIFSYLNGASLINGGYERAILLSLNTVEEVFETENVNVGPPDIRYNTLLLEQERGFVPMKLNQEDEVKALGNGETIPLIRLPEMYYIAAEYYMESGQLGTAIEYLNTVRSSRGIVEQIPATADQATVEEELLKEYRKEFITEGQLFFFYKRKGLTTFLNLSADIIADDDVYVLPMPDSETIFR